MKTKSQNMSEWVLNLEFKDIPKRVIHLAKEQLFGMLGACYSGSTTVGGEILKKALSLFFHRGFLKTLGTYHTYTL